MNRYFEIIVEYFMNSLEEFASAVKFPTANYTKKAFFASLVYLAGVVLLDLLNMKTIVKFDSALTCSILLCVVALIDASTRSSAKKTATKLGSEVINATSKLKTAVIKVVQLKTNKVTGQEDITPMEEYPEDISPDDVTFNENNEEVYGNDE